MTELEKSIPLLKMTMVNEAPGRTLRYRIETPLADADGHAVRSARVH